MRLFHLTGDRAVGTYSCAERTALTLIGIDGVIQQLLADTGRTLLVLDMSNILIAEVAQRREDRVRSRLAETRSSRSSQVLPACQGLPSRRCPR